MESSIEVRQNNRCLTIRNLQPDHNYQIGRAPNSDICIPAPEVSREHARVYCQEGQYVYEDISSAGSIYNDGTGSSLIKGKQASLNHGDIIRISDIEIIYRNYPIKDRMGEFDDRTSYSDLTLTEHDKKPLEAFLQLADTNGRATIKPINKPYYTIGSDQSDHLQVQDKKLARAHCAIKAFNRRHYLESPFHTTRLNGARVPVTPTLLRKGDVIEVNDTRLVYQYESGLEEKNQRYGIVTRSPKMWELIDLIEHVADIDMPVLIVGETGTGKELVAKAIHQRSQRNKKNFVSVNCANIDQNLFGSELFGHKDGAFTGAKADRAGYFVEANQGTLFLDELVELSSNIQTKLLRAIEYNEIRPIGANSTETVDVRVIAATNQNINLIPIRQKIGFRDDLYHRLSTFVLTVPPLRERKEDIPLLMDHFLDLAKVMLKEKAEKKYFASSAYDDAQKRSWRGNVRELANMCIRSICLSETDKITALIKPESDPLDYWQMPEHWPSFLRLKKEFVQEDKKVDFEQVKKELGITRATWFRWDHDVTTFCRQKNIGIDDLMSLIDDSKTTGPEMAIKNQ